MRKRLRAKLWLLQAHVPVVPGLRLHEGGYDFGPPVGRTSCYLGDKVIGWEGPLKSRQDKIDLYHEAGHAFIDELCTPEDLFRIKRIAGFPDDPWFWGQMPLDQQNPATATREPLEERFADLYSGLALSNYWYPRLREFLWEIRHRTRGG